MRHGPGKESKLCNSTGLHPYRRFADPPSPSTPVGRPPRPEPPSAGLPSLRRVGVQAPGRGRSGATRCRFPLFSGDFPSGYGCAAIRCFCAGGLMPNLPPGFLVFALVSLASSQRDMRVRKTDSVGYHTSDDPSVMRYVRGAVNNPFFATGRCPPETTPGACFSPASPSAGPAPAAWCCRPCG
jgi:hypothetical protein